MARVLTCTSYDEGTQTCTAEAWVEQPSNIIDYLPTVEEADAVGKAFFFGLVALAALVALTKPQPE